MHQGAIAQRLLPSGTLTRDISLIIGGAALTAVCAQASIPLVPVPLTLQTLAVTLCGITMGVRLGVLSQLTYLAAGACGLPVFADASFGISKLIGPTGGYLWAFVGAAALLGWLAERGWDRKLPSAALALALANLLILTVGAGWLALFMGVQAAWTAGFAPFISGAVIKSAVVMLSMPLAWKLVGKESK